MNKELERNSAVDFWKFIFVIIIAIGYLNSTVWRATGVNLIFNGGKFLPFFMFLAGYYLMKYYQKNKNSKNSASMEAWNFTKKTISRIYPVLLGGVFAAFVVRNAIAVTKITDLFGIFMDSIWEFLGLSQIGLVGLTELKGTVINVMPGFVTLWNGPLWYFSALMLATFILYYVISKNEDLFNFLVIIFIILVYGSFGLSEAGASGTMLSVVGLSNNLSHVIAAMGIGMLTYYLVEHLKKKKFNEPMMMLFSVLHVSLAMLLIYLAYKDFSFNDFSFSLIIWLFTVILLVNKDYISVLYNDSKLFGFLGKLAIYYYACFVVFIYLLAFLFPEMGYHASIIFNILFTTCWAFIMYYIDQYFVTPLFRNPKKSKNKKEA